MSRAPTRGRGGLPRRTTCAAVFPLWSPWFSWSYFWWDTGVYRGLRKFKDKSGLKWENYLDDPKKGKYTFIERSYEDDDEPNETVDKADAVIVYCVFISTYFVAPG
ncbi:hypothetical protein N7454_005569 [Penicillium verhagenii]|nr:hypothetical protein N7454_005569 [Penicillium verhagenii]